MARGVKAKYATCIECGKKVALNNERAVAQAFYKIDEDNEKYNPTGVYDICKKCMKDKCYDDPKHSQFNKAKFIYVLKNIMNRPYMHDFFERTEKQCKDKPQNIFTEYVRRICVVKVFGKTWKDGDTHFANEELIVSEKQQDEIAKEIKAQNKNEIIDFDLEEDFKVTKEMISFWGKYDKYDYMFLENYYNDLITIYEHDTPMQVNIYKNMAKAQLQGDKALEEGRVGDYEKSMRILSSLSGDANVKPVQETGANAVEQSTFGVLIDKYENENPIPEPRDEFKDVDGIEKYFKVWFLGHLLRMQGKLDGEIKELYENETNKFTIQHEDIMGDV